jgi:hypothetical protein
LKLIFDSARRSPDFYGQNICRARNAVYYICSQDGFEIMVFESRAYSLTEFLDPIWIHHEFARRRCSAHPDAGNNDLDLPGRIIVHARDQGKITLDRRILGFQIDLPRP